MSTEFNVGHLRVKKYIGIAVMVSALAITVLIGIITLHTPQVHASNILKEPQNIDLKSEIKISFDAPFNRAKVSTSIQPKIDGDWEYSDDILSSHSFRTVTFKPATNFEPNTTYVITIDGIAALYGKSTKSYSLPFKTINIPEISSVSIEKDAQDVPTNTEITFFLSAKNNGVVDYSFYSMPSVELIVTSSSDSYHVSPKTAYDQATKYIIYADQSLLLTNQEKLKKEKTYSIGFTTKSPPKISTYKPNGGGVYTDIKSFEINFSDQMNKESVLSNISISPAVDGAWVWESDNRLIYKINKVLNFNTRYSITLRKGVSDIRGGSLTDNVVISFSTIGNVIITSVLPTNKRTGVSAGSNVSVVFDQEVNHTSAEDHFSITPKVSGGFSWVGNKLIFDPSELAKDSTYTVNIGAGVESVHGLALKSDYTFSFSTEESITQLNIPVDLQDSPLTCEAASLKMALRYRGVDVSESEIMNVIGYDTTSPRVDNVWGNPFSAFVGDINGKQNTTGYGVYWSAVANAAKHWRSAEQKTGMSASSLADQIHNGYPVLIWGVAGKNPSPDSWYTISGALINAWKGEHVRLVIGYKGNSSNPTAFIINDPYYGRLTWAVDTFKSNWGTFGNSAVVIY